MNELLKEKEAELTLLSQRQLSDEDRLKLESIPSTLLQLHQAQQQNVELHSRLTTTEQRWSQSLSNEKAAMHSVSDLVQKFNKRWTELTTTTFAATHDSLVTINETDTASTMTNTFTSLSTNETINEAPQIRMSKQIHELQYKLQQAMDNVRQAELSRENLKITLTMNATLQSKLDELKSKYAVLQNSRTSGTASAIKNVSSSKSTTSAHAAGVNDDISNDVSGNIITVASEIVSKPTTKKEKSESSKAQIADSTASASNRTSTSSASTSEKLIRDYRKVRKELAAMTSNRTVMTTTNLRLLKQITGKR